MPNETVTAPVIAQDEVMTELRLLSSDSIAGSKVIRSESGVFRGADCWYGVADPVQRKKIQDRLAQRARRKRLAQAKGRSSGSKRSQQVTISLGRDCMEVAPQSVIERSPLAAICAVEVPTPHNPQVVVAAEIPPSVYGALLANGAMMGITCSSIMPSKSSKVGPEIPEALRPTALQLTTIHHRWIDRFPFPIMRDNFITLSGIIDEEDFLRDLFSMESFTIKPGKAGWDPSGWTISKGFAKKWGYLFY